MEPAPEETVTDYIEYTDGKSMMKAGSEALHEHLAAVEERALGKKLPQLEIRFDHVSLSADVKVPGDDTKQALPTLINHVKMNVLTRKHKVTKHILKDISGVFKASTMTLIIGQPGSGKSAFLKLLSGRFSTAGNIKRSGNVMYNGIDSAVIGERIPQLASFVAQRDMHYAPISVKRTFGFAHECAGYSVPTNVANRFNKGTPEENEVAVEAVSSMAKNHVDVILRQLGLDVCENTLVGDRMLRGISGGEKKRTTLGEMLFGERNLLCLDEISTGLDSAATLDIMRMLRSQAKQFHKTVVVSLLQPPPEVFELFDDVLIFNRGYIMYHGPIVKATPYFNGLGFTCPPGRDIADFLMDLGTHHQQQYEDESIQGIVRPREAREFSEAFRQSEIFAETTQYLATPTAAELEVDNEEYFNQIPLYYHSFWKSTMLLTKRHIGLTFTNKPFIRGRIFMITMMAILCATTFWQFDVKNVQVVMGMLFISLLLLALGQVPQIPGLFRDRDVFYKQRAAGFYRTSSYVVANMITQFPMSLFDSILFGSVVYWMCGFVNHIPTFILFLVMIFCVNLAFGAFFFFLASLTPDLHVAKPSALVAIVFFVLFSGCVIPKHQIPKYMLWFYWINPVSWSFRALAINQYTNAEFEKAVFEYIPYHWLYGADMGDYSLSVFDLFTEKKWIYFGYIYILGMYIVFIFLSMLVLEYKRHEAPSNVMFNSEDDFSLPEMSENISAASVTNSDYNLVLTPTSTGGSQPGTPKDAVVTIPAEPRDYKVPPVSLAFRNLWYSVPDPKNPKEDLELLKGISGYALPGQITALMGSTGAGKTTLMDVIAGRKTGGKIRGEILLNGHPATDLSIRRSTGYCEQVDVHSDGATIREALTFSAFLRQSSDVSDQKKLESVEECLELLDMQDIADQIVRGSSVEQMKRLTIGVELAAQPSVLFLDEPTSGLDARSAKIIMDGVRKVADSGRTVICTIHQPSWKVFQVFDKLLLLKMGGQTVFFGDIGKNAEYLVNYFEAIPNTLPLPHHMNPATWMLEVIGAGVGNMQGKDTDFIEIYKNSSQHKVLEEALSQEGVGMPSTTVAPVTFAKKRAATNATQAKFLIQRLFRHYWRLPTYNVTRFIVAVVLGLIFGLAFNASDYSVYQGLIAGQGMIFLSSVMFGFVGFYGVLAATCDDRAAFYRERAAQTYNAIWYFAGTTLVEIPYVLVNTFVNVSIMYFLVGFHGFWNFMLYAGVTFIYTLMNVYMGQFFVYISPDIMVASILGVTFNASLALFTGFTPPAKDIPRGYRWIYHINPHRYIVETLSAIVFGACNSPDDLGCNLVSRLPPNVKQGLTASQFVDHVFYVQHDNIGRNIAYLAGFTVLFRILGAFALRYLNFQKT